MATAKKSVVQNKQSSKLKGNKNRLKTANGAKAPKLGVPKASYKKSELFKILAEQTGASTKVVKSIFESFQAIIQVHLAKGGPS